MRKGQRISFRGEPGKVVEAKHVTPGMIDIKLDSESFVRTELLSIAPETIDPTSLRVARDNTVYFTRTSSEADIWLLNWSDRVSFGLDEMPTSW